MKTLRKLLAAVLCMTLLLTLTSCGENTGAKDKKLKVGIVQLIENGAFTDMREGFIGQMKLNGYSEDSTEFIYKNAQGDATNLGTICQDMVNSKVDIVVAIATPAAQAMVNLESDIPVFFISVSNPVGAKIITEMERPDKNATGTSNAIPVSEIFDLSNTLTPSVKSYGFLYNTSEVNSVTTVEQSKTYLDSIGVPYEEAVVANSGEVQQAAQSLVGKVDAIFVPNDSVIQSAMSLVSEVARDARIPVYCSSSTTVQSGGLATKAISDTQIGAITADMAITYLEGTPMEEIPSVVVPATDIVINKTTADILGISIPSGLDGVTVVED